MPKGIYKHKPLSAETRLKMSLSRRGEKHPMFGKKHSKESLLKMSEAHFGHKCSPEHKQKTSQALKGRIPKNLEFLHQFNKGSNHGNWKGDNVKYASLHTWIIRWKGKHQQCSVCGATPNEKRLVWGNKDHKYRRKIEDYIDFCDKCHQDYDKKYNGYKNHNQFTP